MTDPAEKLKAKFLALLPTAEEIKSRKSHKKTSVAESDLSVHQEEPGGRGVAQLLPMLEKDPLFYSEDGLSHILRRGRLLQLDNKNRELVEDMRLDGLELNGKAPARDTVSTVIDILSAKARREGTQVELFNRVGEKGGHFYYDLANGKAVEISPGKWRIVKVPVMFRQLKHQLPQEPPIPNGNPWRFLEFCEMPEKQKLLFIVALVTCFIPRVFHPAIHVSGCQGSGKSMFTSLWKIAIDNSIVLLSTMPRKPEDLDLLLVRYYGLVLDNLSALSGDTCDRLCSFITGGVIEKRTLHTDMETTLLKANSVIFFSSIGTLHSRPDLTERSIVFELDRVPEEKNTDENSLRESFRKVLPEIHGGIFDLLAKAMAIFPTINLAKLPRMAGFAKWGYAVAEAIGGRGEEFLRDYAENSTIQTGALLEHNTFFNAIVQAIDDPMAPRLSGSFQEVLSILKAVAYPDDEKSGYRILEKDRTFPTARGFRKHLERLRVPLESMGIIYTIDDNRTNRAKAFVCLKKKVQGPELIGGVPF
jgi:hypothetical protein